MSEKKRASVLGESTFNFIAQIASKMVDSSSSCSPVDASAVIKQDEAVGVQQATSQSIHDEPVVTSMDQTQTHSFSQASFEKHFESELVLSSKLNSESNESKFGFELLSKAYGEYKDANFLKGCKW